MDYIINIQGGIGKVITATTFIRWLHNKFPDSKINVMSAWPEVFYQNPHIYRNLPFNTNYVYDDYVKDSEILFGEPYSCREYINKTKHISELWPKAMGFGEYNDNILPEIFISKTEYNEALKLIEKAPGNIITVQFQGGNQIMNQNKEKENDQRNFPHDMAQLVVDKLKEAGYAVVHVRLPHEKPLAGAVVFNNMVFRAMISLLPHIVGHIGIDSSYMHAVAATDKPCTIFWQATNHNVLGYKHHTNIVNNQCPTPMCGRPHLGVIQDHTSGGLWACPHGMKCTNWGQEIVLDAVKKFISEVDTYVKKNNKDRPVPNKVTTQCKAGPCGQPGLPVPDVPQFTRG